MSRDFPDWINPWTAAEGRRIYRGTMPLAWMPRLSALMAVEDPSATNGEASFQARFALVDWGDSQRRPVIDLSVSGQLPLVCQASLQTYLQPVERRTHLGVVANEQEAAQLPAGYEPVQADHGRLALVTLVEDELILGLPQIPRRPGMETVAWQTGQDAIDAKAEAEASKRRPFAGLEQLLRDRDHSRDAE